MAISRTLACANGRQWLAKSLVLTFNITQLATPQRRNFSAPPRRYIEARERIQQADKDAFALNDINEEATQPFKEEPKVIPEEAEAEVEVEAGENGEHIPWYLRGSTPLPSTAPDGLADRQRIPELPEHPPPILSPLLKQISVDLGIDDLTLLDLRSLDPPPALGANLLMLIGTARSEKHLHVSADKLCRWLRSEYYLSPYADGLLGRQELKLKLRRKAKKSKLMSAVGGKGGGDSEDLAEGIRTGWVCVNVGEVEGAEGSLQDSGEQVMEKDGEFVGFGPGKSTGVRIVVQMLTEEKREEVDLEKLWNAVLKKSEREKEAIAKQEAVEEEIEEVVEDVVGLAKVAAEKVLAEVEPAVEEEGPTTRRARIRGLRGRQQIRTYHTSVRRMEVAESVNNLEGTPWEVIAQSAKAPGMGDQVQQAPNMQTTKDDPEEFYRAFRSFPALRVRRSVGLYTILFNHIADGAFQTPSPLRTPLRDDAILLGLNAHDSAGLPADLESGVPTHETLQAVRGSAEARAILAETLCSMASEEPPVSLESEGGVQLAMAALKAIRTVDPEGGESNLDVWRGMCERVLRKALDAQTVRS